MENYRDIIKAPIITEKTSDLAKDKYLALILKLIKFKLNKLLKNFSMLRLKVLIQLILMQKETELDVILVEPTK